MYIIDQIGLHGLCGKTSLFLVMGVSALQMMGSTFSKWRPRYWHSRVSQ
jgi:hypothetical protein